MGRLLGYLVFVVVVSYIGVTMASSCSSKVNHLAYERNQQLNEI